MKDAKRGVEVATLADRLGPPPTVEELELEDLQPTGAAASATALDSAAGPLMQNTSMRSSRVCSNAQPCSMPLFTSSGMAPATSTSMARPASGASESRLVHKPMQIIRGPPCQPQGKFGMVVSKRSIGVC